MAELGRASDSETQLNRNYFLRGRKLETRVNCGLGKNIFTMDDVMAGRARHDWNSSKVGLCF